MHRYRGARLLFGDQTLFCRTADFKRVGGYAARLPIMEDADLCIRLHMAGPGAQKPQDGHRAEHLQPLQLSTACCMGVLSVLPAVCLAW